MVSLKALQESEYNGCHPTREDRNRDAETEWVSREVQRDVVGDREMLREIDTETAEVLDKDCEHLKIRYPDDGHQDYEKVKRAKIKQKILVV